MRKISILDVGISKKNIDQCNCDEHFVRLALIL